MKLRDKMKKNVLIVGGYRLEKAIATSLLKRGCIVTVVNDDNAECQALAETRGLVVINGDGTRRSVLEDAEIKKADILIAVTDSDEKNLVIAEMAKHFFGVKKTVALLDDGEKSSFSYKMGVDRVISPLNMVTTIMENETIDDVMTERLSSRDGRMIIEETAVTKDSTLSGKKLWELNLPEEIIIGSILRGDQNLIPRGDTRIQENDILLVLSSSEEKMDSFLKDASL
ncbi:MAG: potassium channel family protein [Candidatus Ornithospirochaeta sp.]